MKNKELAIEAIKRLIGSLSAMVDDPGDEDDIIFGRNVINDLEADIAKAVEPVAYQVQRICPEEGPSIWQPATATEYAFRTAHPGWNVRKLYTTPQEPAAAAIPEGWKLVPLEPTIEMILAFNKAVNAWLEEVGDDADVYKAMLAAAPESKT